MEIGSIFLILALLVLVGLFVGRPLMENSKSESLDADNPGDHEWSGLLAERDRLLNALKELEFDHLLGKIPEAEYPLQRASLMQRGVEVLKRMDEIKPDGSLRAYEAVIENSVSAQLPRQLALIQPRAGNGWNGGGYAAGAAVSTPDDELEVLLSNRRRVRQEKAAGFCPKCGNPCQVSDRFCPRCGAKTF
jgi:hypothetical protein